MSLFTSGVSLAFFTIISRVFGLFRELFIAQIFGVGSVSDSVNVAFKLPNLFRRILGEGALANVFIPLFNSKFIESPGDAKRFTAEVFTLLLVVLISLVLIMQIFMPSLMFIIAPGFYVDKEKFDLTVLLCRISVPYIFFISIAAFFGAILNSNKKFASFAFSPVILNVVVIIATLINVPSLNKPIAVALSLLLAGLFQVIFMYFFLKKDNLTFPLLVKPVDKDVKKFLINMVPASLSAGMMQLNLFISQTIASFIPGAISILSYAERIYQFPLSIIGISFGTVLLPELSRMYKKDDKEAAIELQNKSIMLASLLSFPAMIGIMLLSKPIIHIIYERGLFNTEDTNGTARTLAAFAVGLPAFILAKILTPIFYAKHDFKTPLKLTIYSMIINTALNIILMRYFGYVGIAIGSSFAAWINVMILYQFAKNRDYFQLSKIVYIFSFKVFICCLMMAGFLVVINNFYGNYYYHEHLLIKIVFLGISVVIGGIIFTCTALFFKLHKYILNHEIQKL